MIYRGRFSIEEMKTTSIIGQQIGKWTVVSKSRNCKGDTYTCQCECGTLRVLTGTSLRHNISFQCKKCMNKAIAEPKSTTICSPFDDRLLGRDRLECRHASHREKGFCT